MCLVVQTISPKRRLVVAREIEQGVDQLHLHCFGRRELLGPKRGSRGQIYIPCCHPCRQMRSRLLSDKASR
jgi:hypothetical protein